MTTYICMNTITYMMASKDELNFIVKGKLYTIKRQGNIYYLIDENFNSYKIKNYSIDCDSIIIKYVEIPKNELNELIKKIFNFEGLKEILRQYLQHGLFTLDSYGE